MSDRKLGMLIITRGLPGSGKTTWAKMMQSSVGAVRANRDDLRRSLFGTTSGLTHQNEETVTVVQTAIVKDALHNGNLVIVDDTNLKQATARRWANLAKAYGVDSKVADFTEVPLDECHRRNHLRGEGERVPSEVIDNFYERYLSNGRSLPEVVADDEPAIEQYTGTPGKPDAWIVDIDGTLAINDGHRSPYDYTKVHLDKPNPAVITAVNDFRGYPEYHDSPMPNARIIVLSGRTDDCKTETTAWLNNYVDFDAFFMRKYGDHRKDSVVKEEIFWAEIAPNYNVIGVLDDRQQVVDMWRSIGLTCFQVNEGSF